MSMVESMITAANTIPRYTQEDLEKAIASTRGMNQVQSQAKIMQEAVKVDSKAVIIDPNNILNYVGTRAKPNYVGAAILRSMAMRCKPVAAIIKTRLNQFSKFTRRPRHDHDTGLVVGLKDRRRRMTPTETKAAFDIEDALLRGGVAKNALRKDNLDQFTRKVIRDSLILDGMVWENVFSRKGQWSEMWAVDAATIEMVIDRRFGPDFPVYVPETAKAAGDFGQIAYVQKIQGQVYAEFTEQELTYRIRNPRTDIDVTLFGLSELEELIETVTYILNAERYNGSYFNESHLPQGVLSLIGQYDDEVMENFKRNWENMTSGVVGKWKVPVIASSDGAGVQFIPFKQSSKDMEYHQWMTFLTTIACAIYQIAPEEIGFEGYSAQGKSSLSGDDTDSKVNNSKDKGLEPLALFYENALNSDVIENINPDFCLRLQGISDEDEARKWDLIEKKITMGYSTVALERKANDEEPILDPKTGEEAVWPHMPAQQQLAQFAQSDQQNAAQAQSAEDDHDRGLETMAAQHAMSGTMQNQQMQNQDELAENQHGRNLESQQMQAQQQQQQQGAQFQHQVGMQAMKDSAQALGERGKQSHELTKMDKQHAQALTQQSAGHTQKLEQQQVGHEQNLQQMDKQHTQQQGMVKNQNTHDLRKMGLQHGLSTQAAKGQHERQVAMEELKQAYAYLGKMSEEGDDTGRSQAAPGKSKGKALKKGLETPEGGGLYTEGLAADDGILLVIRLTD